MKKLFLLPLFALLMAFCSGAFAQSGDMSTPDGLVKTVTSQVLDQIKADKQIQSGNITRITQLVNEKMLLIRTYSGALAQVRDQEVQYKPFRADPSDTDVVVRSVVLNNGSPIELDYRLYKTPQGWKVYDINVLGAWLIQAYQQQFNEQIHQHGVDGLVQFLTQRNQQLASGKAS